MVEVARKKPLIFNPDEETKEMLIASFVIRTEIFNRIFKEIKEADKSTAPQHFLLVGQRGMGKTTMLLRLKYAIADDPELSDHLITVKFSEEQYQIGSLVDLWEEIMHHLENQNSAFKGLYQESIRHEKEKDYERLCFNLLAKKLKQENKRIILLIDNINDLFKKLTDIETRRLREVLMTSKHLQLIGASSSVLEHGFQYDKPFFEFFDQIKLAPIGKNETIDLMKALGENYDASNRITEIIKNNPQRIEALRRITGGVPRTLVLLFEILIDSNHGAAFEDLEALTDRVTALYKERMDNLKPQQQRIMDALARAWEPITANEVLELSKLYRENIASNQVSSQLKQLEDNQLVEVIQTMGRRKSYRIRERFFNIWYLMRHGHRSVREKVLWLVRFLETWCSQEELKYLANKQIAYIANGNYSHKAAFYKAVALHGIKDFDSIIKKELLNQTESFLLKFNKTEWASTIRLLSDEIEATTKHRDKAELEYPEIARNHPNAIFHIAHCYLDEGNLKKTEELYIKVGNLAHKQSAPLLSVHYLSPKTEQGLETRLLKASEKDDALATLALGILYADRGDINKAEQFYLKGIQLNDPISMLNLGVLYEKRNDLTMTENIWQKASNLGNTPAMFNLGILYESLNNLQKAEEFYMKAAQLGDTSAIIHLGTLHSEKGNKDEAERFFIKAIDLGNADALFKLGTLYDTHDQIDKAEYYYLKAVETNNLGAMNNLASLYLRTDQKIEEAEALLMRAVKANHHLAAYNLVSLYISSEKFTEAQELCKTLLSNDENDFRAIMVYIMLMLRTGRLSEAVTLSEKLFSLETFFLEYESPIELVLHLLDYKQYHSLLHEYRKQDSLLKKHLAPVYYVIAWFLKDELPGEYEKAGAEIKESVDEMIALLEKK
jgi:TPR repeat protein